MRKIRPSQILVFVLLISLAAAGAVGLTAGLVDRLPWGDFRGVALTVAALLIFFGLALAVFRLFMAVAPLRPGDIPLGSQQEFVYHVYLLFFLLVFYPVIRAGGLPVPLARLIYQALGARLGANTYASGIIFDPRFVSIGDNSLVGQYAILVPHAIENEHLAHQPITIGHNVTIGAHATVLGGCVIEDGALVAIGAVVAKGTHIRAGEVWGGVPARRLSGGARQP